MRLLKKFIRNVHSYRSRNSIKKLINIYKASGAVPWSKGYLEYKWQFIKDSIYNPQVLQNFDRQEIKCFGKGIDERAVEYPWLVTKIIAGESKFLDAGSTFNFEEILRHPIMKEKDIYIYTYYPESNNFSKDRISYIYGDLRTIPFQNNFFDQIVCQSTLEHIDMDNSIYGYNLNHSDIKFGNYEYIKVILELERILKPGGDMLFTFPYGKFENHGFFQQFNASMVQKIEDAVKSNCTIIKSFFKYKPCGWKSASESECEEAVSYNPHTGQGKGEDNAAHSRAICAIKIIKRINTY